MLYIIWQYNYYVKWTWVWIFLHSFKFQFHFAFASLTESPLALGRFPDEISPYHSHRSVWVFAERDVSLHPSIPPSQIISCWCSLPTCDVRISPGNHQESLSIHGSVGITSLHDVDHDTLKASLLTAPSSACMTCVHHTILAERFVRKKKLCLVLPYLTYKPDGFQRCQFLDIFLLLCMCTTRVLHMFTQSDVLIVNHGHSYIDYVCAMCFWEHMEMFVIMSGAAWTTWTSGRQRDETRGQQSRIFKD